MPKATNSMYVIMIASTLAKIQPRKNLLAALLHPPLQQVQRVQNDVKRSTTPPHAMTANDSSILQGKKTPGAGKTKTVNSESPANFATTGHVRTGWFTSRSQRSSPSLSRYACT